jgi:hypothetical protein
MYTRLTEKEKSFESFFVTFLFDTLKSANWCWDGRLIRVNASNRYKVANDRPTFLNKGRHLFRLLLFLVSDILSGIFTITNLSSYFDAINLSEDG